MSVRTKDDIAKAFNSIDKNFEKLSKSDLLKEAFIEPFHEQFPLAKNGICAMIAPMGAGKSYTYTKLMAKQEVVFADESSPGALSTECEPIFETIVICSTSADFDQTVRTFKTLVKKSKVVVVKDELLLEFLEAYMKRLLKHSAMMDYIENELTKPNEEMTRLIKKHRLTNKGKQLKFIVNKLSKYNWSTSPHRMLLILDDFASHPMLKSKEAPLSRILKKLRHYYINVIICVQTCKSIPKDIKRCLADLFLFPGISQDDFKDLVKEVPLGFIDKNDMTRRYYQLKNSHDLFAVHLKANQVVITLAK